MKQSQERAPKEEEPSSDYSRKPYSHRRKVSVPTGNSRVYAKTGQWTDTEKMNYLSFLKQNQQIFTTNEPEALKAAYREMSQSVKTRKPNQCKLYHLKMQNYYQSVSNIIHFLTEYLEPFASRDRSSPEAGPPLYRQDRDFSQIKKQKKQPNNELYHFPGDQVPSPTKRKRKLSLSQLPQDPDNISKDQDLPKTDHSISFLPPTQNKQIDAPPLRTSLPLNFAQVPPIMPELSASLSPSVFYPAMFHHFHALTFMRGFEESDMYACSPIWFGREKTVSESYKEWVECHSLFLAWQEKSNKILEDSYNKD